MEDRDIIIKLENAGKSRVDMPDNMSVLKSGLVKTAAKKKPVALRLAPVYTAVLLAAAIGTYMTVDSGRSQGTVNDLGGIWCTYDDSWQGGDSKVWPPASAKGENNFVKSEPGSGGKGYAIRITGTTGSKLGWDYIGVNTFLSPHSTCPECAGIDLTRFTGVKFKIKGTATGGRLAFIIPHEARAVDKSRGICRTLTSYADYECDITGKLGKDWKDVIINFRKELKQPSWAKPEDRVDIEAVLADANIIKWQFTGAGHNADVWIDKLEFY
jgi:hypothetical protein